MKQIQRILLIGIVACALPALGQTTQQAETLDLLKGRPDAQGSELLGGAFESRSAGIAFHTPVNARQVKKSLGSDEIAEFMVEAKNWRLSAVRTSLAQPLPLSTTVAGKKGLLELTVDQLKQNNPNAEVVRQDTTDIGDTQVGMIAARFGIGTSRMLCQEAIFQANDQLYYTLSLISPAARPGADGKTPENDPAERDAVDAFRKVIETVKLLDRAMVKEDQDQRLFRTRALFVSALNEKNMRAVLLPEQWLRLIKDGKDIGYTHVIEETKKADGTPGVYIGMRSYTTPEPGSEANAVSWLFVSFDRKHEDWTSVLQMDDPKTKKKNVMNEFGSSDWRIERVLDQDLPRGEQGPNGKNDEKQPPMRQSEVGTLTVTTKSRDLTNPPLKQKLPVFYIQQAVGYLLPRLLPRNEPKTYLFATYVSERREVMLRYVDVGYEQDVDLGGKRMRAVPIQDRLGLEADPTVHYVSPDGKYLGSLNKAAGVSILPTDVADIQQRWPGVQLDRPAAAEAAR